MDENICKLVLGISITLLILSSISAFVIEKDSAQYYVLIITIVLNLLISLLAVYKLYKKRNS